MKISNRPYTMLSGGVFGATFVFITGLLFFSLSYASEPTILNIDEGSNRIALTLCNMDDGVYSGIRVFVDNTKFPAWLTAQCEPQAVNVSQVSKSIGRLFIVFTVKDAPANAETTLPLLLKDTLGNMWEYSVLIRTNFEKPIADVLIGNYPNPFNPDTVISLSLSMNRNASLVVYNSLGQKVRKLMEGWKTAGNYIVKWDGKDETGRQVSSGVYFYQLITGKYVQTRKMIFVE